MIEKYLRSLVRSPNCLYWQTSQRCHSNPQRYSYTHEEEEQIIKLVAIHGRKWEKIAEEMNTMRTPHSLKQKYDSMIGSASSQRNAPTDFISLLQAQGLPVSSCVALSQHVNDVHCVTACVDFLRDEKLPIEILAKLVISISCSNSGLTAQNVTSRLKEVKLNIDLIRVESSDDRQLLRTVLSSDQQLLFCDQSHSIAKKLDDYQNTIKLLEKPLQFAQKFSIDPKVVARSPDVTKEELMKCLQQLSRPPLNIIKTKDVKTFSQKFPEIFAVLSTEQMREVSGVIHRAVHNKVYQRKSWNFMERGNNLLSLYRHPDLFFQRVRLLRQHKWTDGEVGGLLGNPTVYYPTYFFVDRSYYPDAVVENLFDICFGGDESTRLSPSQAVGTGPRFQAFLHPSCDWTLVGERVKFVRHNVGPHIFAKHFVKLMTCNDREFMMLCQTR